MYRALDSHMATIERTDIRWHVGLAVGALCVSAGWLILVTITGQLLGWMLVAFCTPRLPSCAVAAHPGRCGRARGGGARRAAIDAAAGGLRSLLVASYVGTARR
jgi:hypothetical protein